MELLMSSPEVDLQESVFVRFSFKERTKAGRHRGFGRQEAWRVLKGSAPIYHPRPQDFYLNYRKKRAARINSFYETFFEKLGDRHYGFVSQKVFWYCTLA